jgi:CCR4-NOT transcription complex subunit 1
MVVCLLLAANDLAKLFPEILQSISKDVEDEANGYFQRLYHHPNPQMSVDDVLAMLKKFQDSTSKRERVSGLH